MAWWRRLTAIVTLGVIACTSAVGSSERPFSAAEQVQAPEETQKGITDSAKQDALKERSPVAAIANIRVVRDDEERGGSHVALTLRLNSAGASAGGLVDGWRLCFTWLKAVVLQLPRGAKTTGSYVELQPQPALAAGRSRLFMLALAPPAMRYASDLPRNLHIIVPMTGGGESTLPVELASPTEAHIRYDPNPPGPSGIVPLPLDVMVTKTHHSQWFQLPPCECGPVEFVSKSAEARPALSLLKVWAREWPEGAPLSEPPADNANTSPGRIVRLVQAEKQSDFAWFGREGYELLLSQDEVVITAASAEGFHRGAASLRQLLSTALNEGRSGLPPIQMKDRPRFTYRGLMVDVARHFVPVTGIRRILDWMYLYKLNVLHWHLTDDEAWRLEIKALPNLTLFGAWRGRGEVIEPQYGSGSERYGGFYSQEEIRDTVLYAAERGISIVPEIDVPGHCYAAIRSLPGLLASANVRNNGPRSVQGYHNNVLDLRSEATYEFLEAVFSEVAELFPAPLGIHIGMDEVPNGAWSDTPSEEIELKTIFAKWLQQFLATKNKALLGWEEAFYGNGIEPSVGPRPPTAFAWKEIEKFAVEAVQQGFKVVLCSAHFLYLDIVEGHDFEDRGLYWATPTLPIDRIYAYEPTERLIRLGLQPEDTDKILGIQASLWSETVDNPQRIEEMLFPRLLAVAEVAWTAADRRNKIDFSWRLPSQMLWLRREFKIRGGGVVNGLVLNENFLRLPAPSRDECTACGN